MSGNKRGALQSTAGTARSTDTVVRHAQIIGADGNVAPSGKGKALILTNASAVALTEDSDMNGLHTIVLSGGGAQDADFYIPIDTVNVNEQIVIRCALGSAVVINTIEFQTYAMGIWISDPAYSAGPVAADGSSHQYWTSMFPLRDLMNIGNKHRVRVNVAGNCTVACSTMVESK